MFSQCVAVACLVWYFAVFFVCGIGIYQIRRENSKAPGPSLSNTLPLSSVPHVTIIRPVKGVEPYLYECLAATFHQRYPAEKLTVYFCLSSRNDPAFPILERVLSRFPAFDAKILVEEEDPNLSGRDGRASNLGPNPKIRNMSRAYREAKGDIVWIIDCNVWISAQVAGRMVDLLCGLTPTAPGRKYKFVHQLPLVVDVSVPPTTDSDILSQISEEAASPEAQSTPPISTKGGLLEELFLSTSHAKFYVAISTVAIAPCIVGKSNMFRRSHLNALTATSSDPNFPERQLRRAGIDYFSDNICEDHLIGDLLWKSPVPASIQAVAQREGRDPAEQPSNSQRQKISWGHHGLLPPHPSNLATQPTMNLSLSSYTARRIRWLRARKFTVPVATLVEAGTESLLCSIFGAWGLTTLPWCNHVLGIPQNWTAFFAVFAVSIGAWAVVDRWVWNMLQHGGSEDAERPIFGRARGEKRAGKQWLLAWCGREALAFPIWLSAVFGGVTVAWRGRRFWVGLDMRVHEIGDKMDGKRKA